MDKPPKLKQKVWLKNGNKILSGEVQEFSCKSIVWIVVSKDGSAICRSLEEIFESKKECQTNF